MWRDRSQILQPDDRYRNMVRGVDPATGPQFVRIEDMYSDVEPFTLGFAVPEEIRQQFDIARNAYVYSWFEFNLITLAEMHAFTVMENAIRLRARIERSGLKPKTPLQRAVNHARANGWLKDEDFGFVETGAKPSPILDAMVMQRNHLMHGNPHLYQYGTLIAFEFCFDVIQMLFPTA